MSTSDPDVADKTFALEEDGTITLNGHREEMDLVAERLAREMMSR